jgi:hypothetical protein
MNMRRHGRGGCFASKSSVNVTAAGIFSTRTFSRSALICGGVVLVGQRRGKRKTPHPIYIKEATNASNRTRTDCRPQIGQPGHCKKTHHQRLKQVKDMPGAVQQSGMRRAGVLADVGAVRSPADGLRTAEVAAG